MQEAWMQSSTLPADISEWGQLHIPVASIPQTMLDRGFVWRTFCEATHDE